MTNFIFTFSAFAVENRRPLTCVWVETGNPRQPLACRWIAGPAEPAQLQSEQALVEDHPLYAWARDRGASGRWPVESTR